VGSLDAAEVNAGRPALRVAGAVRRFGSVTALAGVDLEVRQGEMLTLLGPSGSGKTTLLKMIAGFEMPDEGSVFLEGRDVTSDSPAQRDIGMVFQNYALFPHMTVTQNVAFPLEMRKVPKAERERRVQEVLSLVDLPTHGTRLPRELSGGQQQRVALARAVVFNPSLLLLDEPFGALDRKLREQMQLEVRRLQQRLGLTAVFVTHDQEEALILSDRIAVMDAGRIAQLGSPQDLYQRPANRFVANFIGESNLFRARMASDGHAEVGDHWRLPLPANPLETDADIGVLLRPERVRRLADTGPQAQADVRIRGKVTEVVYLGETVKYRVAPDDGPELIVRWPFRPGETTLAPKDGVTVGWDRRDVHWIHWS
jgi:spermidine/putrescine ABC transporter ATP-binding subunit